ncbi:MAG: glycosyltransferase [Pyrinomonadaceae bacterium]
MARTLYICYFGIRQPLVQTQVIPYLLEIMESNALKVSLLTFEPDFREKWTPEQVEAAKTKLAEMGIEWHCLPYHKRFSAIATAYDIFRGAWFIRAQIRENDLDILHGRVHVPALMGALARKFSKRKPKLLFDIRGFFPEEYTDAGVWPENGWLYRSAKRVERWLMKEADGFVVLTERAREILFPESKETGFDKRGRPVEVIPCCVDLNKFAIADESSRAGMRQKLNVEDRFVIVYVGSFGGWYMTEEMMALFAAARDYYPRTFALILTPRDKEKTLEKIRAIGFDDSDCVVNTVSPEEISGYLNASDCAVSFIKACYSKQSSSPTKIAEYLACGLPIIANRGVGDVDKLIEDNNVGVMVDDFTRESYLKAISGIKELGAVAEKCRQTARREFDLEKVGGERYRSLYTKLLK